MSTLFTFQVKRSVTFRRGFEVLEALLCLRSLFLCKIWQSYATCPASQVRAAWLVLASRVDLPWECVQGQGFCFNSLNIVLSLHRHISPYARKPLLIMNVLT